MVKKMNITEIRRKNIEIARKSSNETNNLKYTLPISLKPEINIKNTAKQITATHKLLTPNIKSIYKFIDTNNKINNLSALFLK